MQEAPKSKEACKAERGRDTVRWEQRQKLETDTPHTTMTLHVRGQERAGVYKQGRRAQKA